MTCIAEGSAKASLQGAVGHVRSRSLGGDLWSELQVLALLAVGSGALLVGKSLVNLARIALFLSFGPFQLSVDVGSGLLPGQPLKMARQEDVPSTRAGLCRPRCELEKEQVVIHAALPSSRAFPPLLS